MSNQPEMTRYDLAVELTDILGDLNDQLEARGYFGLTADQAALIEDVDHYSNDALGMLDDFEARLGIDVTAARDWIEAAIRTNY